MRVIIVEDEEPARELLRRYLAYDLSVEVVGEYPDGFSGAVAINRDKPDLVLLDIQLPKLNGFELLEILDYSPQIIFTTAYDEYAIKAFEQNATDYLLKPFSKERFFQALNKARGKMKELGIEQSPPEKMVENLTNFIPLDRVVVKDNKGIHILSTQEIHYIEAQDDYVLLYTNQGRFIKKQTMKNLEQRLSASQFVRVHRSFIVNVLEISRIEPYEKDSFIAKLKNGSKIKVSASGYKTLRQHLDF